VELRDSTYRAIELLRFLRRATPEVPWTTAELAIAIAVEDEDITSQLAPLYHLDESKEDNIRIHKAIKKILSERKKQGQSISLFEAVKRTLNELVSNRWVIAKKGKGCWLSEEGWRVRLLDILHAFGEDAGTARCCRERDAFACPYRRTCRAYKFHRQLSTRLRKVMEEVTVEDIALGSWSEVQLCSAATKKGQVTRTR